MLTMISNALLSRSSGIQGSPCNLFDLEGCNGSLSMRFKGIKFQFLLKREKKKRSMRC